MLSTQTAQANITGLTPNTTYQVKITARDAAGNVSPLRGVSFTIPEPATSCSDFCFRGENDRLVVKVGTGDVAESSDTLTV
jgi:hypothetical protein